MDRGPHARMVDAGAAVIAVGSVVNWLPDAAGGFAVLWYGIQMWESKTGSSVRATLRRIFKRSKP